MQTKSQENDNREREPLANLNIEQQAVVPEAPTCGLGMHLQAGLLPSFSVTFPLCVYQP